MERKQIKVSDREKTKLKNKGRKKTGKTYGMARRHTDKGFLIKTKRDFKEIRQRTEQGLMLIDVVVEDMEAWKCK